MSSASGGLTLSGCVRLGACAAPDCPWRVLGAASGVTSKGMSRQGTAGVGYAPGWDLWRKLARKDGLERTMDARDRKWVRLLVGMLVLASMMGWGLWKWGGPTPEASPLDGPRAQPGEAGWALDDAWGEELAPGSQEHVADEGSGALPWREDPGDLGWDEDLGKEGYLVWRPRLALVGPWTGSARPLPGAMKLLDEELPHGFCRPGIQELFLELFAESHMYEGTAHAIADNPKVLQELLPKFKSEYFKEPEIDLYGPRDVKKGSRPVSSRSSKPGWTDGAPAPIQA